VATETTEDTKRLVENQRNLLEVMPEMMLLVNGGRGIEYMNAQAKRFFENQELVAATSGVDKPPLRPEDFLPYVEQSIADSMIGPSSQPRRMSLRGMHFEYTLAPFHGYKGDRLYWLSLRDITQQNKHIEELSNFHNSIESILTYKIKELKESERVRKSLANELNILKEHLRKKPEAGTMIGSSKALTDLRDMIFQVAKTDATILITGESGTGKELVANLIRESSNRKEKPFLKINCNTINDSLLESDLFGYEKGAFTGANTQRKGKFEVVNGGTIFLDEIGDITPRMQAAMLRVLQEGEIIRVGGNMPLKVDVRIIAATNVDLAAAVQKGTFRLDLFYRLNIINICIPPLRQRKEDIVDLTTFFVRKYRNIYKKEITFLPQTLIDHLLAHDWPGNVRELENVIQRAVLMAKNNAITENDIIFDSMHPSGQPINLPAVSYLDRLAGNGLKDMLSELETEIINHYLEKNKGNVARSAEELKVGKTAFYDKLKRHGISAKGLK